jgi:hypothetical protein
VQPPRHDPRSGLRVELLQLDESAKQFVGVVALRLRERGFVGKSDLRPQLRRALPVALDLRRVRLRHGGRHGLVDAGAPMPADELPHDPRGATFDRQLQDVAGDRFDLVGPAFEPGGLGTSAGDGCEAAQLSAEGGLLVGFFEESPGAGFAAARSEEGSDDERNELPF